MIVNKTKYSNEDFEFISGLERYKLKVSPKKVFSLVIDILIVVWGSYMLYMSERYGQGSFGLLSYLIAIMIVASSVRSLYSFFTRKKRRTKNWIKNADMESERLMEFGESSVSITTSKDGITTRTEYDYELIKAYISTENCLYIITCMKSGSEIFMIVHDDSYTEGSKAELIDLLKKLGAAEESV